ncbi:MAG: chloramphenicol acetyltransferase [Clostridiales bacterium]|nr:chloramphenicol acetyltransferase [Clostridiales bacterium]
MAKEVDPMQTKRAQAFALWMKAPMPMITIFKTLNVTRLLKISKNHNYKFHALMCWCIGKAATQTEEFYLLPVGNKLMQYNRLAINTIVTTKNGDINTCDIPFSDSFEQFYQNYLFLTKKVYDTCLPHNLDEDFMVIGTSALAGYEIDGAVNIYAGLYNNPFIIWGKYRKKLFKTILPISFQFHHTQMDGIAAAQFLACLQNEIDKFK